MEDVRSFLADTQIRLNGGTDNMAKNNVAAQEMPADPDTRAGQDADEYLLLEAPIADMAKAFNMSIDDAVKARVAAAVEAAPMKIEVIARPIEPRGKLIGVADVRFGGGIVVEDFKIFNGEKGLFVGEPSKPDSSTRSGFRKTARITDDGLKDTLNNAAYDAYNTAIEKLQSRVAVVQTAEKPSIREALKAGAEQAAKENRPAPTKEKAGHDDR